MTAPRGVFEAWRARREKRRRRGVPAPTRRSDLMAYYQACAEQRDELREKANRIDDDALWARAELRKMDKLDQGESPQTKETTDG